MVVFQALSSSEAVQKRLLRGFWERTYAEVKKELKSRYPKHPWLDDPWTATPTQRARPVRRSG